MFYGLPTSPAMAKKRTRSVPVGMEKTSVNLPRDLFQTAYDRAERMGITFSALVERALERDIASKMMLIRTSDGAEIYTPVEVKAAEAIAETARRTLGQEQSDPHHGARK